MDLNEGNDQFQLLIKAIPIGLLIADRRGKIYLTNPVVENIFGYAKDELLNASVETLLPESFRNAHAQHRNSYHDKPSVRQMGAGRDLFGIRKDGTQVSVEIGLTPIRMNDEPMVMATIADITARKKEQIEIQQLHNQLWRMGSQSVLGQLSAAIAHELNQPLAAILSNSQALQRFLNQDPIDKAEIQETAADIIRDVRRASDIIMKVRSLLRKSDFELKPIQVSGVLLEIAQLVCNDAVVRAVSISIDTEKEISIVLGDRTRLCQVFMNLIFNSFEAMEGCENKTLHIRLREESGNVVIRFKDSGSGFKGGCAALFEPFFSTKKDGMGMGLAICRQIVEGHKGALWAENNADGGASFFVSLPLSKEGL